MQALRFQYSKCLQQTWNKWKEVRELTDGKSLNPFCYVQIACTHMARN